MGAIRGRSGLNFPWRTTIPSPYPPSPTVSPAPPVSNSRMSTRGPTEPSKNTKRKMDDQGSISSSATKQKRLDSRKCSDLVVLGIPFKTTEEELKEYFKQFGEVVVSQVKKDYVTGKSKGFGFIRFADYDSQVKALGQKHQLDGRTCEVKVPNSAKEPPQSKKVFVGRLSEALSPDDIKEYFASFGEVTDVYVPKPFRSFAFVTFEDSEIAKNVLAEREHVIKGFSVNVTNAAPRGDPSPRQTRVKDATEPYSTNYYASTRRSPPMGAGGGGAGGGGAAMAGVGPPPKSHRAYYDHSPPQGHYNAPTRHPMYNNPPTGTVGSDPYHHGGGPPSGYSSGGSSHYRGEMDQWGPPGSGARGPPPPPSWNNAGGAGGSWDRAGPPPPGPSKGPVGGDSVTSGISALNLNSLISPQVFQQALTSALQNCIAAQAPASGGGDSSWYAQDYFGGHGQAPGGIPPPGQSHSPVPYDRNRPGPN